ncbi:MAG: cyclopropane-fatty-acyl-phospholipid synthase family protein [Alphaproteobacteria bacterium]|nr:cyclopropane-fatty-acyl-phospholipid synthase family protein [Alphaproteobacteria bacterium]
MLVEKFLKHYIRHGYLIIVDPDGKNHVIEGVEKGPEVTVRIHNWKTFWKIAFNPGLAVGEAYMDGTLTVDGDIYSLMEIYARGLIKGKKLTNLEKVIRYFRKRLMNLNTPLESRRNVAHHYDLGNDFYRLFLDQDMQYSCAYFEYDSDDLETAQLHKKQHIASKLRLQPGNSVLDIGCGWGGLALYCAQLENLKIKGITLSARQLNLAQERLQKLGLQNRVQFELKDYRHINDQFDRIMSVGMFEHVGVMHYDKFFEKSRDLLKDDGVMLLHTIGHMDEPGNNAAWLTKYIFPGGYTPSLSEVTAAIERQNLFITDIEIWRLHYAKTLHHWRERFHNQWDTVKSMYDERFCRMWDFYLAGCEASFEFGTSVVFQIQITKKRDAVPQTRDYINQWKKENTIVPIIA